MKYYFLPINARRCSASSINGRRVRGIDPPPHFRTLQFYKHVIVVSLTRSPHV